MTCETRSGGIARPGAVSRAPPGAPGAGWGATPSAQQTRPPSIDQQQAQACVRREDKTCQGDRPPVEFFAPPAQGAGGDPCGSPGTQTARKEAGAICASPLPAPFQFRYRKLARRDNMAGAPGAPGEGLRWTLEIESPVVKTTMRHDSGVSSSLGAKLAAALSNIRSGERCCAPSALCRRRWRSGGVPLKGRQGLQDVGDRMSHILTSTVSYMCSSTTTNSIRS